MHDTRWETIVINCKFVKPEDYPREMTYLTMADARVTEAAVTQNTIYDLLRGNVPEARPRVQPYSNRMDYAAITRAQVKQNKRELKSLKIAKNSSLDVSKQKLISFKKDYWLERFYNQNELKRKRD